MTTIETYLNKQKSQGIPVSEEMTKGLETLAIAWYSEALSEKLKPSNPRADITTADGRRFLVGYILGKSKHWVCDSTGALGLKYPRLFLAYNALGSIGKVLSDDDEYRAVASLMRFSFIENYGLFIQNAARNLDKNVFPYFVLNKETGVHEGVNPIYDRQLMAYMTKPNKKGTLFFVSYYDHIPDAFWGDVFGFDERKRAAYMQKRADRLKQKTGKDVRPEDTVRLLRGVKLNYEYRLLPNVLSGEFAFTTQFMADIINAYTSGNLMNFRTTTRGRKPKTVYLFEERMYPRLSQVLNSRLEAVLNFEIWHHCGIEVNYVTPYFFSFFVPLEHLADVKELQSRVRALRMPSLNVKSLTNGYLL